jgi:hypothetical protein
MAPVLNLRVMSLFSIMLVHLGGIMKRNVRSILFGLCCLPVIASAKDQGAVVAAEVAAFANLLSLKPTMALDFSDTSREYCFNAGVDDGGHMTHYAIEPLKTQEDVIDFINAEPLVKAGLKVELLPPLPKLGAMKPHQWYYLAPGKLEPHHGVTFPYPMLLRATNIK